VAIFAVRTRFEENLSDVVLKKILKQVQNDGLCNFIIISFFHRHPELVSGSKNMTPKFIKIKAIIK